jgi:glutamate/tyrosine decarboxylase-like PLP-dependent enzyme
MAKGYRPFFVNCTSGSTVYGSFDPINAIADICQKHNIWMHIDVGIQHYYLILIETFRLPGEGGC